MMRYKLLLFLILLPLLTKSKNVRPKRPQSYGDQESNTQFPLIDQLALADNWKSPSRVISATYSGDPDTGRVNQANLVINIVPRTSKKPANVDIIASQSLANAKTAEEYVSKALEMKHKYDHTTPSSSFVKYDIYEKEKTKRVPVTRTTSAPATVIHIQTHTDDIPKPNHIENHISKVHGDTDKSASEYHEYYQSPKYGVHSSTTTTTYKQPDAEQSVYDNYGDLDAANSDFTQQLAAANYETFGAINNINYDNQKSFSNALQHVTSSMGGSSDGGAGGPVYPSKQEMYDYIERAVKKYMRKLESEGKFSGSSGSSEGSSSNIAAASAITNHLATLSVAPTAHAEIKTYYRFPSSTVATPVTTTTKLYSMGTHSEFFKPVKSGSGSVKIGGGIYSTVKPFIVESYTPEAVDLTVRSKKRPKPIDLSALDVGQSWSHNSASSEPAAVAYLQQQQQQQHQQHQHQQQPQQHHHNHHHHHHHRSKALHKSKAQSYNAPSYQEINALPYAPNRGIIYDEYNPSASVYAESANAHNTVAVKEHPVGASISFGGNTYEADESVRAPNFTPSMQVINGVPVSNPYKYNVDSLNDVYEQPGTRVKESEYGPGAVIDYGGSSVSWNPSYNYDFGNLKESSSGNAYTFDTYNPKYNNNPEGHGYQDSYKYVNGGSGAEYEGEPYHRQRGTIGSDMYASGSSHRPKKIIASHHKRQPKSQSTKIIKVKQRVAKQRFSQHSRDLQRDLTPPPADY